MKHIIETKNLCFQDFLRYPNISIEENTVTFIRGASGCGKSTLFKLFNGTISPSTGCVMYHGEDISLLNKIELRRDVLLVKQVPYLFQGSIYENFMAFHQNHESICPSQSEITDYLKLCCIPVEIEAQCDTMSGGERQRVYLSIAISLMPKVLLLDEPTSALNNKLSIDVLNNITAHSKHHKISLVIISHDLELQSVFAEKIIELRRNDERGS
ncbi:ATP-binding cassette domain-containing protein [uncultured Robinsoniella sp.]|uniref:ABC transporter ATP-binding protein n=1 Tax=uncultured Robinsoniella sp. TaxID=904190 RepID=UPI00374EDA02